MNDEQQNTSYHLRTGQKKNSSNAVSSGSIIPQSSSRTPDGSCRAGESSVYTIAQSYNNSLRRRCNVGRHPPRPSAYTLSKALWSRGGRGSQARFTSSHMPRCWTKTIRGGGVTRCYHSPPVAPSNGQASAAHVNSETREYCVQILTNKHDVGR